MAEAEDGKEWSEKAMELARQVNIENAPAYIHTCIGTYKYITKS